jgi:Na+-transporting NADH:ubiquinone oxidoreductase subunit NqrC
VKSRAYTVAFTMLLSALCAAAVTSARAAWGPMIEALEAFEKQQAVLVVFGIVEPGRFRPPEVARLFQEHVVSASSGDMRVYEGRSADGEPLGVAFEVNGKGRNGDVFGIMAVEPDRRTIRGLWFYRHKETPGYGGRIGTAWFSRRFVGKPLAGPDGTPGFGVSLRRPGPRTVDAITGATQTTYNVVEVINERIRQFIAGGRELTTVEIELPTNVSSDIGLTIDVPNLARPTGKPRPPLMVPEGTTNIARGRPVTASDEPPIIGELTQVTDGVKQAGFGNFVELMDGPQWVQVDLGRPNEIYAVVLWHEHEAPRVYYDVIAQLAEDEEFSRNVRTVFNNDADNSAGLGPGSDMHYVDNYEGKLVLVAGEVARYVRLYSNGNHVEDVNRYTEVEVYGRPAER